MRTPRSYAAALRIIPAPKPQAAAPVGAGVADIRDTEGECHSEESEGCETENSSKAKFPMAVDFKAAQLMFYLQVGSAHSS